jgi:diacylglycerol kinase (ATP)
VTERVALDQAALIVNTGSRAGAKAYAPAKRVLRERGVELLRTYAVEDPKRIADVVREAVEVGCRLIIVGGGDGTIGPAAGVLARQPQDGSAVLAVLPLGTANDFARTLDVPDDVAGAAEVVATGKIVDIDLGWANELPFVNVASLGLSVGSAEALRPAMKKTLGPVAYPMATAIAYSRHQPFALRMEFPDGELEPLALEDLLQVSVGNGRYYGGGRTVAPDAGIDDHKLDVTAIKTGHWWDHLSLSHLLKDGTIIEHEDVRHLVTRALRIATDTEQAVNLDGEIVATTPVDFSIQRNAVEVVVPQHVTHLRHDSVQGSAHEPGSAANSSTEEA